MAKVGPYIPTLEEAQQLGVSDPEVIKMIKDYHAPATAMNPREDSEPAWWLGDGRQSPSADFQAQEQFAREQQATQALADEQERVALEQKKAERAQALGMDYTPDIAGAEAERPLLDANQDNYDMDPALQQPNVVTSAGASPALSKQKQAVQDLTAAKAELALEQQQEIDSTRAQLEEIDKNRQLRKIAEKKQEEDQYQKMEQALDTFSNHKIDSSRLFASMNTGSKVMTGLAMALGAFGAMRDGQNRAATIIRNAIKQDINIQKAEADKLKGVYLGERNLYKDMQTLFENRDQAEAMTEAATFRNLRLGFQSKISKYNSAEARAQGMELLGKLEQQEQEAIELARMLGSLNSGSATANPYGQVRQAMDLVIKDPKDREIASQELIILRGANEAIETVKQEFGAVGTGTRIPYGEKDIMIKGINSRTFGKVKEALRERFTDKDALELAMKPYYITQYDVTNGQVQAKARSLIKMIKEKSRPKILKDYNLVPKSLQEPADIKQTHNFGKAGK